MRRFIILLLSVVLFAAVLAQGAAAASYLPYTDVPVQLVKEETSLTVNYAGLSEEKTTAVFCNGRLCLPLYESVERLGGRCTKANGVFTISLNNKKAFVSANESSTNRPVVVYYNGREYISVYELLDPVGYMPVVDITANRLDIFIGSRQEELNSSATVRGSKKAYIRLEDIAADGLDDNPKYTVDMLEKLKYTAQYLYERGQEYYVAWIPVYANPAKGYWNDISRDFNLYNAYFVYVLDYMSEHGGHIGLHGYTHQYGNVKSADGWEWGEDTPYGRLDQQRRMIYAKQTAARLGFKEEFFEFPHYGATNEQLLMAEHYFDAIYQDYPSNRLRYSLTYTTRSGKKVYYIPTPAEYVYNYCDRGIFDRIYNTHKNGRTMSLYYHPIIDQKYISAQTEGETRVWSYSNDGILPNIVNEVTGLGYTFSDFRK